MRIWTILAFTVVLLAARSFAQSPPSSFASDRGPLPATTAIRAASLRAPVLDMLPTPAPSAPAKSDVLPIDLPTALRIANASSPVIALAQARVREALGNIDRAIALRLPTLSAGGAYFRHDGIDQNRKGELFTVSRSNLFEGGGASLRVDTAEAYYAPLIARRQAEAEAATAHAPNQ